MRMTAYAPVMVLMTVLTAGCGAEAPAPDAGEDIRQGAAPPRAEFHRVDGEAAVLDAARAIIRDDRNAALVTLDDEGRPRVRTVFTSEPEADMTIWIATRPATRKVEQIRRNPAVALYYNDDEALSYVSIMGTATLHEDLATIEQKTFFDEAPLREFWPEYPKDFLLIRVRPQWVEVTGRGIDAHPGTWRPQAVEVQPIPAR